MADLQTTIRTINKYSPAGLVESAVRSGMTDNQVRMIEAVAGDPRFNLSRTFADQAVGRFSGIAGTALGIVNGITENVVIPHQKAIEQAAQRGIPGFIRTDASIGGIHYKIWTDASGAAEGGGAHTYTDPPSPLLHNDTAYKAQIKAVESQALDQVHALLGKPGGPEAYQERLDVFIDAIGKKAEIQPAQPAAMQTAQIKAPSAPRLA